jgi:hypothetical protein
MYTTDMYEGVHAETITMTGANGDSINAYLARPLGDKRVISLCLTITSPIQSLPPICGRSDEKKANRILFMLTNSRKISREFSFPFHMLQSDCNFYIIQTLYVVASRAYE